MPEKTHTIGALASSQGIGGARPPGPNEFQFRTANAREVLHSSAILKIDDEGNVELDDMWMRRWACATRLGQGPSRNDDGLLAKVVARRRAALKALCGGGQFSTRTIEAEPMTAIVVGTGTGGIRDVGIELHGTYGWPVLPGTTLKGVAHSYGRYEADLAGDELATVFGAAAESAVGCGAVTFLDALPHPDGVEVAEHVLTPHTRGYQLNPDTAGSEPNPPAEYINPVPIPFLVVSGGSFSVQLIGPEPAVGTAAQLLAQALGEIGVGAKTTSGYGYMKTTIDAGTEPAVRTGQARKALPGETTHVRKKGSRR